MIPAERQKTILALLSKQEVISINELVEQLGVSHMTIRRDIAILEKKGKVLSVSGGVQLTQLIHHEASHEAKATQHFGEKERIGKLASTLIKENSTVYLDAGTTTLEIARELAPRSDLLVVTNDFVIANYLMQHSTTEIYHTGGRIDRENQSSIGSKVADFLEGMNIDLAFVSTSSWNLKGISTPSEPKVIVKKAIAKSAQTVVLVSDSSKYGKIGIFHALDIEEFNVVVTDENLSPAVSTELKEKGISILQS
ncbi:DeoR faimly transcriptional regulator [Photobacterium kishitanii]|uniref:DeoR/GlpR transcriptional regulator n=1 Tax=Photobacterium kishitanii TaxID=318456 RepID=A0AAX0YT23_9GAMM|nr:DeoR/GlpR family DNA-binding transcription regulator [Photobacterium kishitanii]KJG57080.1 DeoR faimly transcriptional regulator [Photobacterium kishitanii]KJG60607.1 DeoR faimly transcriptional regulator [Photobacterium kishitanii]KJG64909.1 DeoR faimly transcriptional regulator [Photobacterium kishitanii]KJG68545.1 DeoR faimly transcriptional regulator [Photobacterium kishitanii]OBU31438.1 DeoR family transcriptional regulator [Photobacterium kishitanii]